MPKHRWHTLPDGTQWNQAVWEETRKRVLDLAGNDIHCAICGKPLDRNAPRCTAQAVEIDHIVPIARGGAPYEISNLQTLCFRCNRRKGKRMDSDHMELNSDCPIPQSNAW